MFRKALFTVCLLVLPFSLSFASMGNVKYIFRYANQRFQMMRGIAAYKYKHHLPINITIPERVELRNLYRYINQVGLDAKSAHQFIVAGVLIGKSIQLRWFKRWRKEGLPQNEKIEPLKGKMMQALLTLDERMIDSLVLSVPTLRNPKNFARIKWIADQELTADFLTKKDKATYIASLLKVKLK